MKMDNKNYELKDHLGNVRFVFDDVKKSSLFYPLGNPPIIPNQLPFGLNVKEVNNYYPFGMLQPGLCYNSEDYRFGFNGMLSLRRKKKVFNKFEFRTPSGVKCL